MNIFSNLLLFHFFFNVKMFENKLFSNIIFSNINFFEHNFLSAILFPTTAIFKHNLVVYLICFYFTVHLLHRVFINHVQFCN